VLLHLREIEQGLLVGAVRLLQRAARCEDICTEAKRFVAGLEVRASGSRTPGASWWSGFTLRDRHERSSDRRRGALLVDEAAHHHGGAAVIE
jgi:hypothetical protein